MKWGLKGGISIYADSGPPRYVLWCCGGICHELLTFIQIGCGHTVICFISRILISTRGKYSRPNFCQGVVLHFFFYFKVPNVRMYLLNPFLKLVRWKKCRRMPWQKFLFFYIYLFLFCRVPLAEILVICGFLMIYLIEELAHVLLHKVRSAEKSKDECSVACTGMKSSINSISRYKWSSTYAISTVAQFLPSYAIFPSFFPSYSISPKVISIVQFVFHTNWKQNKFLFSCLMIALMAWNNL